MFEISSIDFNSALDSKVWSRFEYCMNQYIQYYCIFDIEGNLVN